VSFTPFQTLGPFFDFGLVIRDGDAIATPDASGRHVVIEGTVRDGNGEVLSDALVEVWQANAAGKYRHPADHQDRPLDPAGDVHWQAPTFDTRNVKLTCRLECK